MSSAILDRPTGAAGTIALPPTAAACLTTASADFGWQSWPLGPGGCGRFGASVRRQLLGRLSSGVDGAAHEVGDQLEFGVGVAGEELVHRTAESGVEA